MSPLGHALNVFRYPPDMAGIASRPIREEVARHIDTDGKVWALHAVKVLRERVAVKNDSQGHVGFAICQVHIL
jgi:hypothetical protein